MIFIREPRSWSRGCVGGVDGRYGQLYIWLKVAIPDTLRGSFPLGRNKLDSDKKKDGYPLT